MSKSLQNAIQLLGRLLLVALFLPAGLSKLSGFDGTVGYISSVGLPLPVLAAAFALTLEIVGSLAILSGIGARVAALALAVFTIVASFFFHNYWGAAPDQAFVQQLLFFKNMAVAGGLLLLSAQGVGEWRLNLGKRGAPLAHKA